MASQTRTKTPMTEDVWVAGACDMCFTPCGIRAHRVNGVITKVEGNRDFPYNRERLCAKGQAALMSLYDPNRLKTPMKRTNPEKGVSIDPKWQAVSWEEALDTVAQRLKQIRAKDPTKLIISSWDRPVGIEFLLPWATAYGTPETNFISATWFCGDAMHQMTYLTNGTFHSEIDLAYCNYAILFGNQHGHMVGCNANLNSQLMAEARMRGMKLVVIDPVCTHAASKADEWIPIRPGTDAALALCMLNLLVNEYGLYDAEFLRTRTNAPYLVGPDGHYLRDKATNKPLVWDKGAGRVVPFDQARDAALDGSYSVSGAAAKTAFELLREHLRSYAPEQVSSVTTVPAATIRRIAREYGEAARIGSTITLEGKVFPFRPAAVNQYRGSNSHKHGTHHALAIQLLNLVIGNIYVPGGHRGINLLGPEGRWAPGVQEDGLLVPSPHINVHRSPYQWEVRAPDTMDLRGLFPVAHAVDQATQANLMEPGKYKAPADPEALILCRTNPLMNRANVADSAKALMRIPFFVYFTQHLDEAADFADIVLPDTNALERWDLHPQRMIITCTPGSGHWYWSLRQPVVAPLPDARDWKEVLFELAERVGFLGDFHTLLNQFLDIKAPHTLQPGHKYKLTDILDRALRSYHGPERGLEWFRDHGFRASKRKIEEIYPGPFVTPRYPVYYEQFLRAGAEVKTVTSELGLDWDTSDYQAVPEWKPCPAYQEEHAGFDLFAVNYKTPVHFMSWTSENPWLNEVGERHPYYYKVMINSETARRKGIKDRDLVQIESSAGKVEGVARVTECVHPEVVAIAGALGSWAAGKPIARGKGVHFNALLPFGLDRMDMVSAVVDSCVRVKVTKVQNV